MNEPREIVVRLVERSPEEVREIQHHNEVIERMQEQSARDQDEQDEYDKDVHDLSY